MLRKKVKKLFGSKEAEPTNEKDLSFSDKAQFDEFSLAEQRLLTEINIVQEAQSYQDLSEETLVQLEPMPIDPWNGCPPPDNKPLPLLPIDPWNGCPPPDYKPLPLPPVKSPRENLKQTSQCDQDDILASPREKTLPPPTTDLAIFTNEEIQPYHSIQISPVSKKPKSNPFLLFCCCGTDEEDENAELISSPRALR